MPLFDHFPPAEQDRAIADAIKVGNVLKLHCNFTTPPKDKRLILVSTKPLIGFFIINSTVNQFITRNSVLLASQIKILSEDHDFLAHDSFVACHELLTGFDYSEVERQLRGDYSRYLGRINFALRDMIIEIVSNSKTLSPEHIDLVVANLNTI